MSNYRIVFEDHEYVVYNGTDKLKSFGNHFYSEQDAHDYVNQTRALVKNIKDSLMKNFVEKPFKYDGSLQQEAVDIISSYLHVPEWELTYEVVGNTLNVTWTLKEN